MSVFVDTSALYALLDRDDGNHPKAAAAWSELLEASDALVTSNYVVVETTALTQDRLGMEAVAALVRDVLPVIGVEWVTERDHGEAVAALLAAGRRHVSLVDTVSFVLMRRLGAETVFAFDAHFANEGFRTIGRGRAGRR
jgi:predicted nucleic acid-binding protein